MEEVKRPFYLRIFHALSPFLSFLNDIIEKLQGGGKSCVIFITLQFVSQENNTSASALLSFRYLSISQDFETTHSKSGSSHAL